MGNSVWRRLLSLPPSSDLILPHVSAGTLCPHTSHLEYLRECLSHDAAGSGHMGPVRSVDADRYVRSWVLLSDTRPGS